MQVTRVQSLAWEDALEKGMATHSSIFAWKVPWTEGAWHATVYGVATSQTQLSDFTFFNQRQKCLLKSKLIKLYAMRIIDCCIITWTINISFSIFYEPLGCSESQSLLHCALLQVKHNSTQSLTFIQESFFFDKSKSIKILNIFIILANNDNKISLLYVWWLSAWLNSTSDRYPYKEL